MEQIFFIENESELGAGTRGASLGVAAIRMAALKKGSRLFIDHPQYRLHDENHLLWEPVQMPFAKRVQGILRIYERLSQVVADTIARRQFPVVLAGDHASAGGTIAGLAAAQPDKRLGVIWIDAHADLHTPFTTPSGNVHGMPLAASLGIDNRESRINDPGPAVVAAWDALKRVQGFSPKIYARDIILMGVRDTEPEEDQLIRRLNIPNLTVEKIREQGVENSAKVALQHLRDCDQLYISFDVDSLDPEKVSAGTGTPVKGGFTPDEMRQLLNVLLSDKRVSCFELVEVNPCLDDKGNRMAETAFDLLEEAVHILRDRKLDRAPLST